MEEIDHEYWAKEILKFLVHHVKNFNGGYKFITYSNLAKSINYPEPLTGNIFGSNIGRTLGVMGHFFDKIKINGWNDRIPFIQALVVSKNEGLPSDGLKEFNDAYPSMSKEKKLDFVQHEYQKIFQFGNRWDFILKDLGIEIDSFNFENESKNTNLYNPYGSEGSPEHRKLCEYIKNNPGILYLPNELAGIREYPLKSGDKIDVVFITNDMITAVEVKSIKSGYDDLERGLYQCIKYQATLIAEEKVNKTNRKIRCYLVIESELPDYLKKVNEILKINILENVSP